ncbi:hypothetical protein WJX79_004828 [Trebouxia sp. C0005]
MRFRRCNLAAEALSAAALFRRPFPNGRRFGSRSVKHTQLVRAQTVEAPARPTDTAAKVEGGRQTPSYVSLSDKYAIVDAAGTQMLLEEGRWYTCNRLQAEPGSTIKFGRVLASKENGTFSSGRPYLENVTVEAEILEELKGEKTVSPNYAVGD